MAFRGGLGVWGLPAGGLRVASDEGGVVRAGFGLGGPTCDGAQAREVWCGRPAGLWPPGACPHPWSPVAWPRGRASDQVHVDDRVDWEASTAVCPASCHREKREAVTIPLGLQTPSRNPYPPTLHGHWPWEGFLKCPNASRRPATSDLSLGRGQGSTNRQPQATSPSGPLHVWAAEATQCGEGPRPRGHRHESRGEAEAGAPVLGVQGPGSMPWRPGSPYWSQGHPGLPEPCPGCLCQVSLGPSKAVQHLGLAPPAPAPLIPPLPVAPPGRLRMPSCPLAGL